MMTLSSFLMALETLTLDIIDFEALINKEPQALFQLNEALHSKGLVAISKIPGYKESVQNFIEAARAFSSLPKEVKSRSAPNRDLGEFFLGFEEGKEKFQRDDGRWVIDDLKNSYYSFVPDDPRNKWPSEIDLKAPYEAVGVLMEKVGREVMEAIGLIGGKSSLPREAPFALGRMLHYRKTRETSFENPNWCGAHFDHGLFTALLPAAYFVDDQQIPEPEEAGLFVRLKNEKHFRKVIIPELDLLLFQVGEFAQLLSNDQIMATEHCVKKAKGKIDRYTFALFFSVPEDFTLYSRSKLTADDRYLGQSGDACTYGFWERATFDRYIVQ